MKKHSATVFFLLGKRLYAHTNGALFKINEDATDLSPTKALEAWLGREAPTPGPCVIVWEPTGMMHERVDVPRVGRTKFLEIIAGVHEHSAPAIKSGAHGWGFEPITDKKIARGTTRLHLEGATETASLLAFGNSLESHGFHVRAAFPLATVALEAARKAANKNEMAGYCVAVFSDGLLNVITTQPGHGFNHFEYEMVDMAESSAAALLYQALLQNRMFDVNATPWHFIGDEDVIAAAEKFLGGYNENSMRMFQASRQNNSTHLEWEDMAKAAETLSPGHTANLYDSFPRQFGIDGILRILVALSLLLTALFVFQWYKAGDKVANLSANVQQTINALSAQEKELNENKNRIAKLKLEIGLDDSLPKGRADAMASLGAAIPPNFILTHLTISETGGLQMTVLQVDAGADIVALVSQMQRYGFTNCEAHGAESKSAAIDPNASKATFNVKAQIQQQKK